MNFNFISPQNIYFGCGKISLLPQLAANYSGTILLVVSRSASNNPKVCEVLETLKENNNLVIFDKVSHEPTLDIISKCTQLAKENDISLIISIGGGSVIDTAKATAGFATNSGNPVDYIEGVGIGKPIENPPIDHIAVPTTSGTGSEMTKNAVIMGEKKMFKRSFRHDKLVPVAAIIDPELTLTVPKETTAYSGMDAITQLIESFISKKSNVFTDTLCIEGLRKVGNSLITAFNDGNNIDARTNMAYASMISGMCLANSGLGAVHGIAAGLGAVLHVPHGMACAVLLPHIIKLNASAIENKSSILCEALIGTSSGNHTNDVTSIINYIDYMIEVLHIPRNFDELGITEDMARDIIQHSSSSSMGGNPCHITKDEIINILISKK